MSGILYDEVHVKIYNPDEECIINVKLHNIYEDEIGDAVDHLVAFYKW